MLRSDWPAADLWPRLFLPAKLLLRLHATLHQEPLAPYFAKTAASERSILTMLVSITVTFVGVQLESVTMT